MKNKPYLLLALLAGSSVFAASPALAQSASEPPATAATSNDTPEEEPADLTPEGAAAKAAFLEAQVESLQQQLDALKKQVGTVTPSWKGAPQFDDKDAGFSFKPKGFIQYDVGSISNPGLNTNNLGFNSRARRIVFGAEGTLPGGFGYKAEFNLAGGAVDYEDVVLTYAMKSQPLQITIGNFYPLSGLDTMTSSRLGSFLERSLANDAFGFSRRIGAAIGLVDPKTDRYSLTAGIFNAAINSAFNNNSWQASVRGTFSPQVGSGRLHLGANYQHRVNQTDAQNVRYRARPVTQITDIRFVDTGAIAAKGDDIIGLELGGVFGPFHFASEGQQVMVNGYRPGTTFSGLDSVAGGAFYNDDPKFTSGYFEAGYYLTGESRAYKGGKWDRTKVLKPFNDGGWGALQINGRVDFVNLKDRLSDGALGAPRYINGGRQIAYQASAIWNPIDYIRFLLQYSHLGVQGGPSAAVVVPVSTDPVNRRDYGADLIALRAQVEF